MNHEDSSWWLAHSAVPTAARPALILGTRRVLAKPKCPNTFKGVSNSVTHREDSSNHEWGFSRGRALSGQLLCAAAAGVTIELKRRNALLRWPNSDGLQPTSDGLQPTSDGLQLTSDDLQPTSG